MNATEDMSQMENMQTTKPENTRSTLSTVSTDGLRSHYFYVHARLLCAQVFRRIKGQRGAPCLEYPSCLSKRKTIKEEDISSNGKKPSVKAVEPVGLN